MSRAKSDIVWHLVTTLVVEVLNPLLLISLALFVSVGYIVSLLLPVNVDIWVAVLGASILLPLTLLSLRAGRIWRQNHVFAAHFSWHCLLYVFPLLLIFPAAIALLLLPSLNSIAHVDLYFAYVIQIFHGHTPIQNIFVPGYPANHYWLFHALIAAIVKLTSVDTYSVTNLVNLAFLLSSLLWLAQTILALNLAKTRTVYLGVLVIFVFGSVNLTGALSVSSHVLDGTYAPNSLVMMLQDGADRRLHSIFPKVFHASGMTPGITAFTAVLYTCVKILRDRVELPLLVLLSASSIAAIGVMPILAVYIFCALLASLALTSIVVWVGTSRRISYAVEYFRRIAARINPIALMLWFIVSLALALPLLKYIDEFTYNYQTDISLRFFDSVNVNMTLAAVFLLLPLASFQVFSALKYPRRTQYFFAFSVLLGLVLTLGVMLPDQNQYKFHYLLAMLMALSALLSTQQWRENLGGIRRTAVRAYIAALVILALCNAAYGLNSVVDRAVRSNRNVKFDGIHVLTNNHYGGRLSAFNWIRDNSPPNAIVVVPHSYLSWSLLFHERLNYISTAQYFYTDNIPGYDQRITDLHIFYDATTTLDTYRIVLDSMQAQLPEHPIYAVVSYSELGPAAMRERGALVVFDHPGDRVAVYLLNPTEVD